MLAAIVLSAVVALIWFALAPRPKPPAPTPTPDASAPATPAAPANGNGGAPAPAPGAPPSPAPAPAAPAAPAAKQKAEHREFVVKPPAESTWLDVGFTTRGGAMRYVRLKDVYEVAAKDDPDRKPLDL